MKVFSCTIAILFVCKQLASGEPQLAEQSFMGRYGKTLQSPGGTGIETCPDPKPCPLCPECEEEMECETLMCAECPEVHSVPLRYGNCDMWMYVCGTIFCLLIASAIAILAIIYTRPDPKALDNERAKVIEQMQMLVERKDAIIKLNKQIEMLNTTIVEMTTELDEMKELLAGKDKEIHVLKESKNNANKTLHSLQLR